MAIRVATATRNARLDALVAMAGAGSGPAELEIRTGAQPANANTAASGTLLVTLVLNDPIGTVSAGVLTFDVSPAVVGTAVADGDAGWARVVDSDGNAIFDGSVGESDADFIIGDATIETGGQVALIAVSTITDPAA